MARGSVPYPSRVLILSWRLAAGNSVRKLSIQHLDTDRELLERVPLPRAKFTSWGVIDDRQSSRTVKTRTAITEKRSDTYVPMLYPSCVRSGHAA